MSKSYNKVTGSTSIEISETDIIYLSKKDYELLVDNIDNPKNNIKLNSLFNSFDRNKEAINNE